MKSYTPQVRKNVFAIQYTQENREDFINIIKNEIVLQRGDILFLNGVTSQYIHLNDYLVINSERNIEIMTQEEFREKFKAASDFAEVTNFPRKGKE